LHLGKLRERNLSAAGRTQKSANEIDVEGEDESREGKLSERRGPLREGGTPFRRDSLLLRRKKGLNKNQPSGQGGKPRFPREGGRKNSTSSANLFGYLTDRGTWEKKKAFLVPEAKIARRRSGHKGKSQQRETH